MLFFRPLIGQNARMTFWNADTNSWVDIFKRNFSTQVELVLKYQETKAKQGEKRLPGDAEKYFRMIKNMNSVCFLNHIFQRNVNKSSSSSLIKIHFTNTHSHSSKKSHRLLYTDVYCGRFINSRSAVNNWHWRINRSDLSGKTPSPPYTPPSLQDSLGRSGSCCLLFAVSR